MNTLLNEKIEATFNSQGEVEFIHDGVLYRSVGQATFDNSPNNNYSTYSAPLVCPNDEDYPEDFVGRIVWDITNPDCDDESDACNWDDFSIVIN